MFSSCLSSFLKNIRVGLRDNLFVFFWKAIKIAGSAQKKKKKKKKKTGLAETQVIFFRPY